MFRKMARGILYADIISKIEKPFRVRIECQNPLNSKEPLVDEGVINPEDRSLNYGSVYIKGLKIYGDYWVKIILYDSEEKDKVIDELTQKIRSYVDTTGEEIKLYKGLELKK